MTDDLKREAERIHYELHHTHPEDSRCLIFILNILSSVCDKALEPIQKIVDEQAEDDALWSIPVGKLQPISEAYLQQELRRLHAVIESLKSKPGED